MTYELAKQLKDAGFPGGEDWAMKDNGSNLYYIATLSELIEACGDDFILLMHSTNLPENDAWVVWKKTGGMTFGKTPEEAVAKLWLELNRKPSAKVLQQAN